MNSENQGDHEITQLLCQWRSGDDSAYRQLIPLVYNHLRRIAGGIATPARFQQTQATAIVHELYLKMVESSARNYENRLHFFSAAARAMRQILIDKSRKELAGKRGGGLSRSELNDEVIGGSLPSADVVRLDDALSTLSGQDAELAKILELKHFGGMTLEEIGDLHGVSAETVRRQLRLAEAWLGSYLRTG
ncbi:ECF-type sigma factor [Paludibaculum fermentans]|uniref:ECF-type sigma factor n=1 Tax=Paludibaculum fermentans TaxID=1473598 RepID=UPI003EBD0CE8